MSIIIREKSKIQLFNDTAKWEQSRFQDIEYDLIDDVHVRINKLFPICQHKDTIAPNDYRRFHLRIYLPHAVYNDKYEKINKCFICFNGLDELTHFTIYDQIGKGLASKGYGLILLPLPDHLNRNPKYRNNDKTKQLTPSDAFINEGETVFHAFKQVNNELEVLINHINGLCTEHKEKQCCAFFRRFFNKNTVLSLIGYSLGGLVALSNFLALRNKLNSCVLLNSGAKLEDIDVGEFVEREKWLEMVSLLKENFFNFKISEEEQTIYLLFNMIFLGGHRNILRDKLKKNSNRILFILGGSDSVTAFDSISEMEPTGHGLSILKLPGIHHFLAIDTHWDRWFPIVKNMITSFDDCASKSSLWPNDILWSLLMFQLKYSIFDKENASINFDNVKDLVEQDVLARTLFTAEATYSNMCEVMIEMYILMYKTQKNPVLYKDIDVSDFDDYFGAKVLKNGGKLKELRDLLNIQKIMAQESAEVIPLSELYIHHRIFTKNEVAKLKKT